ncbi:hypothetical protein GOBAR_AA11866 [Gossypium barbadense]|uniref:Uncharacterized protein n=1 Tax=Gossypium barbadense TaxID=3634 RepID=A0A2P5XZK7_GOSBA|nr:hypothetical protein GOBAR_AA11866 [Gossypium barbadense]
MFVQKAGSKSAREPCSSNNKGPIYEERRLRVEELDEWRTHKRKPCLDELNIPPNELKVGDKVQLDAADPRIATSESNGEIPLTGLNIFPYGTVEVIHPKFGTFKISYHGHATWPWASLSKQHERETRPCLKIMVETENPPPVLKTDKTTWACNYIHGRRRSERSSTRLCHHAQRTRAWDEFQTRLNLKITRNTGFSYFSSYLLPVMPMKYAMSTSCNKKTVIPSLKKRKGARSSSSPAAEIRHPFFQFPLGPQKELFQILQARPLGMGRCIDWAALEQVQLAVAVRALLTTDPWKLFFGIIEPTYLVLTLELYSTFHFQTVMTEFDDPRMIQFRLSGLHTKEFMDDNELDTLHCHIHYSPSKCWRALVPDSATYDPNYSKASALASSLRYLRAILAHTLTGRLESTGVVNTHDAYFLWTAQSSSLTLIGQMSLQGISSMLHMRMIEKRHETYPPQYRLVQFFKEEDPEDITDDVPPRHEDLPSQPPPIHLPIHAAASYSDISECLTRFEQQCFQYFYHINATLHHICQHLHISSPPPPHKPSGDDDV